MEKIQRTIEVERIVNLIKGFGWELLETRSEGGVLQLVIEKKVEPPPSG
jgi:hypothetical protein